MKAKNKLSASIKSASILAVSAVVVGMTAVGVQNLTDTASNSACVCDGNNSYNSSLPASHPSNRCAQESDNVSWTNWFAGKSRSNQFHFVDLLELLHGHQDSPLSDAKPTSQQNRL
ncbi:hypothetical protein [Shewanella colwelliana]|uniref:Uncharacterized protein n=1 Tax=Shewanella colwelliana TaxID=23 RepID=A0A1E5IU66_SHECO|nr:hypothetical protein [Shewanella colwelliana]MDX1283008.1 hypothetical protein [Shewanella colwelliana]OEG74072.1 hypothetical protein BEL05_20570 [Shewanella colwelliana]GIU45845.1 hypothetical protein TUM3794_37090 [Shewanella colwelliana]